MPRTYSSFPTQLKPFNPDDDFFTAIGKIVRGCAEIEDIVTLFIANLATMSESTASVVLGRSTISTRLKIAKTLAAMREDKALEVHNAAFGVEFNDLLAMRNAVVHGTLLGLSEDGRVCFSVETLLPPDGEAARTLVLGYAPEQIKSQAQSMPTLISWLETTLQVQRVRQERSQSELPAHPKGRKPRSKQTPKTRSPKK